MYEVLFLKNNGRREAYKVPVSQGMEYLQGAPTISPDGRKILIGSDFEREIDDSDEGIAFDQNIWLIDRSTHHARRWIWRPVTRNDHYLGVAFSQDSRKILLASAYALHIFDSNTLQPMEHHPWPMSVGRHVQCRTCFSPDATRFYFLKLSDRRAEQVEWDLSSGRQKRRVFLLKGKWHNSWYGTNGNPCLYTEDSRTLFLLVGLGRRQGLVWQVFDTATGRQLWQRQAQGYLGLCDDGQYVLWSTERHLLVFNARTGHRLRVLPRATPEDEATPMMSGDKRWLYTYVRHGRGDLMTRQRYR
jgi:hypothetical protein